MALHLLEIEVVRTACRKRIEACELWMRRIIHDKLFPEHGADYVQSAKMNDSYIFKSAIREHAETRIRSQPNRYPRAIDSLLLDQLTAVICREDIYSQYFKECFALGFPLGANQLRGTLSRLVPIRNALSHANPLSSRDAERALCYSSDIIEALEQYYASLDMQAEFNAPLFTRFADSMGNVRYLTETKQHLDFTTHQSLRCGESIRFEVDVDSHYSPDQYFILWQVCNLAQASDNDRGSGESFTIALEPRHVSAQFSVQISVTSRNDWHRHGSFDAILFLLYKVLPPI